ncbi:MAG: sugar transferase [Planctomycetes bacterium]|nr:sugar transferase [Planctomycetota bacterium]
MKRGLLAVLPNPRIARTHPTRGRSFLPLQIALAATDVFLIQVSLIAAFWLRMRSGLFSPPVVELGIDHLWTLVVVTILLLYVYRSSGLYRPAMLSRLAQSGAILKSVTLAMVFLLSLTFMTKTQAFVERRSVIAAAWLFLVTGEVLARCVVFPPLVRRVRSRRPALVLGTGECALEVLGRFSRNGYRDGIEIAGLVDLSGKASASEVGGLPVLGTLADLERVVRERAIEEIFLADLSLSPDDILGILSRCRRLDVGIRVVSGLFEPVYPRIDTEYLGTIPLVRLRRRPLDRLARIAKRGIDLAGSGMGLVLLSPVLFTIAFLIKLTSRGPVFFVQKRIGKEGREFDFLKFRTMRTDAVPDSHKDFVRAYINGENVAETCARTQAPVNKIVEDPRVTGVGRFLRRYSLDELPQLLNVLSGDMSLVGPRPPIPYEVEMYREWHKKRLEAIPGITGLWQVSGRNRLSFQEMVLLDLYYLENWSLALDLKILFWTIPVAFFEKAGY